MKKLVIYFAVSVFIIAACITILRGRRNGRLPSVEEMRQFVDARSRNEVSDSEFAAAARQLIGLLHSVKYRDYARYIIERAWSEGVLTDEDIENYGRLAFEIILDPPRDKDGPMVLGFWVPIADLSIGDNFEIEKSRLCISATVDGVAPDDAAGIELPIEAGRCEQWIRLPSDGSARRVAFRWSVTVIDRETGRQIGTVASQTEARVTASTGDVQILYPADLSR